MSWSRALRALVLACGLVAATAFVAGNFVVVDVRLWGLDLQTRLGWAVLVPSVLAFFTGFQYARSRLAGERPRSAPHQEAGRETAGSGIGTSHDGDGHRRRVSSAEPQ